MKVRLHPLEYTQRDLPFVCAVTGEPAAWYVRMPIRKSLNPAYLLLVFLGPIGWLILLAVLARPESTYVEVPISEKVYDDMRERRRRLRWLTGAAIAQFGLFAFLAGNQLFPLAWLVFLPTIGFAVWAGSVKRHHIRLTIDSVNLVTMHHVSPNFVAAISAWRQASRQTNPVA
jgi:hypothetical protein